MHKFFLLLTATLLLASCHDTAKPGVDVQARRQAAADSARAAADIRLALLPDAACLPFFYAEERGYYKRAGVQVYLSVCDAQADCDTALLGGSADGGYIEPQYFPKSGRGIAAFYEWFAPDGAWAVVSSPSSRAKTMKALSGKVLACDRRAASGRFAQAAVKEGGATGVMYPQIGSLRVRAAMVEENQVDAAVLPEPYVQEAVQKGCVKVYDVPGSQASPGRIVMSRKAMQRDGFHEKMERLLDAYDMAVDSLNAGGAASALPLLRRIYGLSPDAAAKIKLPRYHKVRRKATARP